MGTVGRIWLVLVRVTTVVTVVTLVEAAVAVLIGIKVGSFFTVTDKNTETCIINYCYTKNIWKLQKANKEQAISSTKKQILFLLREISSILFLILEIILQFT